MNDDLLIETCAKIVRDHAVADRLMHSVIGGVPSEADAARAYNIAAFTRFNMAYLARTPAVSLAGCRAKASVVRIIENIDVAISLADDVMRNVDEAATLGGCVGSPVKNAA